MPVVSHATQGPTNATRVTALQGAPPLPRAGDRQRICKGIAHHAG